MKYSINAPQAPEAPGAYSMGTTAGRLIFTAGQIALDPTDPSKVVSGGARAEVERIIEIITILLAECGCTLSDFCSCPLHPFCLYPFCFYLFSYNKPKIYLENGISVYY